MRELRSRCVLNAIALAFLAGVGVGVYVVPRLLTARRTDDSHDDPKGGSGIPKIINSAGQPPPELLSNNQPQELTREEFIAVLNDVISSQSITADFIRSLSNQFKHNVNAAAMYRAVVDKCLQDPLVANGLSIEEFGKLIDKYNDDQIVSRLAEQVVQGPGPVEAGSISNYKDLDVQQIVMMNDAMLHKMREYAEELRKIKEKLGPEYNPQCASLALQAMIGAFVETEFGCTSDDLERAMLLHQVELLNNASYDKITGEIQAMMAWVATN